MCSDETGACFQRLQKVYEDPMMEVYLLFYQAALQVVTHFIKFLQQEDPLIVVIVEHFLKNAFGKFDTLSAIKSATDITLVDYVQQEQSIARYNYLLLL